MNMPTRMAYERVMIPRRLDNEPESGLEGLLLTLTSVALSASGFHALGEMIHGLQTVSEVHEALQPETRGQSEMLARQAFDRGVGQPALSGPTPMVLVESWMPVRRPIDVLDPALRVTDPSLAQIYQPSSRPRTLGEALRLKPAEPTPRPQPPRPSPMAWRIL